MTKIDFDAPGALAERLDPTTVQTPALQILDDAIVQVDKAIGAMLERRRLYARYRQAGMDEVEARDCAEAEVLPAGLDRVIISLPPQEGKSERVTHYGALWMLRRHPELRIAIVSYGDAMARSMSYKIRNDLATFDGQEGNFDVGLRLRKDNRSVASWFLDGPRGSVYATGIGGALTGRPVDLLIIDDPVKDYLSADSQLLSDQAWQWWQSVARTRLAPSAPVLVILTRWHEADLAGRLIAKQREDEHSELKYFDKWHIINIAAQADYNPPEEIYNPFDFDPLGRQPGEFMLSARGRTQAQWEATKSGTIARIWSALFQGRPTPDSGDVFHRPWWIRYETPIWTETVEQISGESVTVCNVHDATEVLQSWDMAFKDEKTSDFVVGQVWARKGALCYLVDQVRARLSFTDSVAAVRKLTAKWPQATVKLIEDKANGPAIINALRKEIGGIIPVQVKDSKPARASAVSPFVEAHNVFLPDALIALYDVEAFIEECTQFPNSAHDDQVDAMSQALSRMYLRGNNATDWLESMAKVCPSCGQPNQLLVTTCSKCGEPLTKDEVSEEKTDDEPFSLTSGGPVVDKPIDANTRAVMEAIERWGPQQGTKPGMPPVPPWIRR